LTHSIKQSDITQSAIDEALKPKLLADFKFFIRYFFKTTTGKKFILTSHHDRIIEALIRVVSGQCPRLVINIPPRYGKTLVAVHMFFAWIMANNAAAKNIHISYSDDLALDNSAAVRDIVKCEDFQRLFPCKLRTDSDSKKKWYTDKGGGLYAVASGGAITGFGAGALERVYSGSMSPADGFQGLIVIDDPLKPDDAFSETVMTRINNRFNNTIASRTNSPETPIVVIMQRLHEDDMAGFLLAGGSGDQWEHLCLPAINEDGIALWPEKLDLDRLEQMRKADPYTFAGQYMQSPSPIGGGQFKDSWWVYYNETPNILYHKIYADTALKTKEENDYTVFQDWGRTKTGVALLDQIRGKWESPELLTQARAFWKRRSIAPGIGALRSMDIEDKASGTGLIQQLKNEIPVVAIQRNTDKIMRAADAAPWIESGCVMIPEGKEWIDDYLHEFKAFPKGKHDDQIDPTMDAIADMLQGSDMLFLDSDIVRESVAAGSGQYMGNDALICGVYIAKSADESSFIQFRRGKDATSETVYKIGWEKSSNPETVLRLIAQKIDEHRPDVTFVSEPGIAGTITDRLVYLGYNVMNVQLQGKPDEELKYSDRLAEAHQKLRLWVIGHGSVTQSAQLEQELCGIVYHHDKNDKLVIDSTSPWVSALALTFAYPVPPRFTARGELDKSVAMRQKEADYNPLDCM